MTATARPPRPAGSSPSSFVEPLRILLIEVACCGIATLALRAITTFGSFGDLFAIGMMLLIPAALAATALLAFNGKRTFWPMVITASIAIGAVVNVVGPRLPSDDGGRPVDPISLVAVNMKWDNPTPRDGVASVVAMNADTVAVAELTRRVDRQLAETYPYSVVDEAAVGRGSGEGIYSKFPLTRMPRVDTDGTNIRVLVGAPTPFVLIGVHLPRPTTSYHGEGGTSTFAVHDRVVREVVAAALEGAQDMPTIVAGDFNMSDRTDVYRDAAADLRDTLRTGWAAGTFVSDPAWRLLSLRIDYIFVSKDWCADTVHNVTITGSDHEAVAAHVGPCPT